jgi:hypothetical protein
VNAALKELGDARQIAANLLVQFKTATDAANRAVMAGSDQNAATFAREAEQAKQGIRGDIEALTAKLHDLGYTDEGARLQEFAQRFGAYDALDRRVLELATQNTNVKAQQLSFGAAQEAADAFRDALDAAVAAGAVGNRSQLRALTSTALASLREIQVLQAPHIADASDDAMTRMEKRMQTAEASARASLQGLTSLVPPSGQPHLAAAAAALDRFMTTHAQIIELSRRNSNVRALVLSLEEKRTLIPPCEESLIALRDALVRRGYPGGRTQ